MWERDRLKERECEQENKEEKEERGREGKKTRKIRRKTDKVFDRISIS